MNKDKVELLSHLKQFTTESNISQIAKDKGLYFTHPNNIPPLMVINIIRQEIQDRLDEAFNET